jgi:hypothetical protein
MCDYEVAFAGFREMHPLERGVFQLGGQRLPGDDEKLLR